MFKKLSIMLLIICLMFTLAACGSGETGSGTENDVKQANDDSSSGEETNDKLKVALVLPGTYNDKGWNASAYEGIKAIESKYNAEVSVAEKVPQSDIEEMLRSFAEADFDIVYGHGFQYGEPAMKIANDYLDTIFVINSTRISQSPNVASIETSTEESGYLAGALAALHSNNNKVFAIGGMEIPTVQIQFEYFEKGAKSIRPNIEVKTTFIGNAEDTPKAKELTEAFIEQGFDVGIVNANQASLGAYEAIEGQSKAMLVGVVSDINSLLPEHTLGSVAFSYPQAMVHVADLIQEGKFEAKFYNVGVKDGGIIFTPNDKNINPEHEATIENLIKGISEGKLNIIE